MLQVLSWIQEFGILVLTDAWWFLGFLIVCCVIGYTVYEKIKTDKRKKYIIAYNAEAQAYNDNLALQQEQEKKRAEQEAYEKKYPYPCLCGRRYEKNTGLSNHKRNCKVYLAGV